MAVLLIDESWFPFHDPVRGRWQTACRASCGWAVCWCQHSELSGPWWWWGGADSEHRWVLLMAFWMQRYYDEILRSIVGPFTHNNHLILLHENAQLHVEMICAQFFKVLACPASSTDMCLLFGMLWISTHDSVLSPVSSSFAQPLKWRGVDQDSTAPRSTTWSNLCEGDVALREGKDDHPRYCFTCWLFTMYLFSAGFLRYQ